jgi:aminoglycoside phosphotransferase (APT) family kinase protein
MTDAAAGRPLSIERLSDGLAKHVDGFVELKSCDRLSGGANQETYRVVARTAGGERTFAMRRSVGGLSPATGAAMPGYPGLRVEARLMQVARAAGVPEPEVYWVFEDGDGLGEGFLMEWLAGETLGKRIVNSEDLAAVRPRLAFQCGEILARIHAIDVAATGLDAVLGTLTPAAFVEQTYARYRAFDTPQPMIDYTARWLRDRVDRRAAPPRLTLVHNDFRNGNLMVSAAGVVAVLDWELAHIGDPMRDIGWICTNSWRFGRSDLPVGGFGTYEDLFAGYESVSGQPVDRERVRFWEVFGSFWWAVGCLEMANAYRTGIDRGVERAAIGRRTSECQLDCANLIIPGPVALVEAPSRHASAELPRADEILEAASRYLRDEVMTATSGRPAFLARVTANALDVVRRDAVLGPAHRARQRERLAALLAADRNDDLDDLRRQLIDRLRDGTMALDRPGLAEYLREAVANQVAIDQPGYSGLKTALGQSGC